MTDKEFWRWEEQSWRNKDIHPQSGQSVCAGVDVGSTSSQAVILVDGDLFSWASIRTGNNSPDSARAAAETALRGTGVTIEDLGYTVGTGYGRVNVPFADKTVTEITCHARGANYVYGPTLRTILDMGGQDCKAIRCDESGKVLSFLMNEKCAAGTGRGMESFAELLQIPIEEIGERSFRVDEEPSPVSSTCVVYAKTEAEQLLRSGWSKEKVLASYCSAMANRVIRLLQRNGVEEDLAITGGIAKNSGIVKRVEKGLGMKILAPQIDTQIIGALGAALIAQETLKKKDDA